MRDVRRKLLLNTAICLTLGAASAGAADRIWDGGGATNNWSSALNWDGDLTAPVANDSLTFDGSLRTTNVNDLAADTVFGPFTLAAGADAFVISGNRITLGGDLLDSSPNSQTVNLAMILNASRTVAVDNGFLTLGGVISGTGFGLTKSGAGQLTLGAVNSYSGDTIIDGGTLAFTADNTGVGNLAFGTTPTSSAASVNTGTLDLTNANLTAKTLTVQTNTGTPNQITIGAGKTLTVNGAFTVGVGAVYSEANSGANTALNVSGNSLVVNGGAGHFSVGIGRSNSATGSTDPIATLNMAGLNSFSYTGTTGEFRVGGGNLRSTATLADNSNIITGAALQIGNSSVNGAGNNSGGRSVLHLGGGTNNLSFNSINIGDGKGGGTLDFGSSGPNGQLTITGEGGGASTANFQIGSSTSATGSNDDSQLNLAGHNVMVQAGNIVLGRLAGGTAGNSARGVATFDTGTFTVNSLQLGVNSSGTAPNGATGTFTLGGPSAGNTGATGVLNVVNQFYIANRTNSSTTAGKSTGSFIINGGTANITTDILDASTTTAAAGANNTTITLDGGTLNMNGRNIGTFAAPITTMNLNSGTFSGAATIAAQTINLAEAVNISGAPLYLLPDNGTLNSSAAVATLGSGAGIGGGRMNGASITGNIRAGAGSRITPGSGTSAGTLNFNNDLTLDGNSTLAFKLGASQDVGNGVNDLINVFGSLNFNGTAAVSLTGINGGPATGTYRLINYSNPSTAISGTNFVVIAPTRQTFALDTTTAGQVNLTVGAGVGPMNLTWRGSANAKWDLATDANFVNDTPAPDRFFYQDTVTFDDTATNPSTVELVGPLAPGSLTVNATRNYTFAGAGGITGATGLTKSGTGTLILANSGVNDYTGGTTIAAGGTLQVGAGGTAGSLPAAGTVSNDGTLAVNRSDALTISSVIGGGGDVKILGGVITLSGASSYSGPTTIVSGATVKVTNAANGVSSLGALPGGSVTIPAGATLDLSPNTTTQALNFGQKDFFVEGAGVGGLGAIVNNGVSQFNTFQRVTLTGDTTIGGSQRYDVRGTFDGTSNTGLLDLQGHTLTKNGTNQFTLVATNASERGNIVVNGGIFSVESTSVLSGTNTVTFNDGTTSQFFSTTAAVSTITRPFIFNGAVRIGSASNNNNSIVGSNILLNGNVTIAGISNNVTSLLTLNGTISETGGARTLTKTGNSVAFLNGANTYSGVTTISGGTLVASILTNGGLPSGIGQSSAIPANLVISSSVFGYNGTVAASTDRQFTMGGTGAGLDASGAAGAPVTFANTAPITVTAPAAATFSLGGSNTDLNVFAGKIIDGGQATSLAKNGAGTWLISNSNTYAGTTTVNGGILRATGAVGTGAMTVNSGGTFDAANGVQAVKSLLLNDAGLAVVSAGVLKIGDGTVDTPLNYTGSGKLDLATRGAAITVTPGNVTTALQFVRSEVMTGYNGGGAGAWQGYGITSSAAASNTSAAVGYALASEVLPFANGATTDTFMGATVDKNSVVTRYTLAGDATLDGIVDFNDLVKLAQNYNTSVSQVDDSWWNHGDFTYDGITDFNDLVKLAQNYNTALPTGAIPGAKIGFEDDLARAFASVPEPGVLTLMGLGALGVMTRRRRR